MNCEECGNKIEVMCFKNTGVCSELCAKARDARPQPPKKRVRRKRT